MITLQDIIQIGTIVRSHGKAGELQCRTINTYWDDAQADFILLILDNIPVPFRVADWRCKGNDLLFTLKGISSEQQAERLVGSAVYMRREDVVEESENGILSWQDIVGYTINGVAIADIDESTPNILASLSDGRLVPLHEDLITAIDHDCRTISMNLPEGL